VIAIPLAGENVDEPARWQLTVPPRRAQGQNHAVCFPHRDIVDRHAGNALDTAHARGRRWPSRRPSDDQCGRERCPRTRRGGEEKRTSCRRGRRGRYLSEKADKTGDGMRMRDGTARSLSSTTALYLRRPAPLSHPAHRALPVLRPARSRANPARTAGHLPAL
jgi:hypothetical protein